MHGGPKVLDTDLPCIVKQLAKIKTLIFDELLWQGPPRSRERTSERFEAAIVENVAFADLGKTVASELAISEGHLEVITQSSFFRFQT